MFRSFLFLISVTFLCACSSEPAPTILGAKFKTIPECLDSISRKNGVKLRVITDKPNEVSGFLGDSYLGFYCGLKETGTEGIYIDGWYEKKSD